MLRLGYIPFLVWLFCSLPVASNASAVQHAVEHEPSGGDAHSSGGAEHEPEHANEQEGEAGKVAATMLIGSICYGMMLLYLTQHSNEYVRSCTWSMISSTMSIFIAVMIYQAFDKLIAEEVEDRSEHGIDAEGEEESFSALFGLPFIHLLLWYAVLQFYCFLTAGYSEIVRMAGVSVLSHVCAFAIVHAFAGLMSLPPFNTNVATAFGALLLSCLVVTSMFAVTGLARKRWLQPFLKGDLVDAWEVTTADGENDMIAIGMGFLISQVLRFAIHGELPPIDPVPSHHEQSEANVLLACGLVLVLCSIASSRARIVAERQKKWERFAKGVQMLLVMTMAWVILFWGHWELYDIHFKDEPLLGRIVLAVLLSILAVIVVFSLKWWVRSAQKDTTDTIMTVLEGMALAIAFSWELAFDRSVHAIAPDESNLLSKQVFKFFIGAFVALLCLPGYIFFFLPKSVELSRKLKGNNETDSSPKTPDDVEAKHEDASQNDFDNINPPLEEKDRTCSLSGDASTEALCKWCKLLL